MHASHISTATYTAPFVLSCSPRPKGNCDSAAALYAQTLSKNFTVDKDSPPEAEHLRSYHVAPCIACSRCDGQTRTALVTGAVHGEPPLWQCPLSQKDTSSYLLRRLALASTICLVAPIYFYHLPAQFKALVDRLQPVWIPPSALNTLQAAPFTFRTCKVILIAGRQRGEHLFTGSLLTLKHALAGLNMELAEPLLLRGYDEPDSLTNDPVACQSIIDYAAHTEEGA